MCAQNVVHDRQSVPVKGRAADGRFFLPALAVAFPAVLLARALQSDASGIGPAVWLGRIAAPGLCLAVGLVLLVPWRFHRRRIRLLKPARQHGVLSGLILGGTLVLSFLDVLAGLEPYLLVPGMVLYALTMWNRPRLLAASIPGALLLMVGMLALGGVPMSLEHASILVIAGIAALLTGLAVRADVAPNDERARSLMAENRELWNLSFRDTLTGLYNRRYLAQTATQLFARATRYKEQLHVLMIDIDHFKRVNDTLGHAVGDAVLKGVATSIQSFIRTSDTAGRYGGEEFIVYLVQSTPEITQFIANRIRDGVSAIKFAEVPWTITISIGVAGMQEGDTLEGLVERADQFLYMSKRHGRNRVSGF